MNRRLTLPVMLAGILLCSPLSAQDNDLHDDRWYITGSAGYLKTDSARETDDAFTYGLGLGRFFTPNLSLDLEIDRAEPGFDSDFFVNQGLTGSREYELTALGLVGRYHFTQGDIRPYAALGLGWQEHDHVLDASGNWFGSVGLGLMTRINDRLSTRFEGSYRYDRDKDSLPFHEGYGDWRLMAQLQVRLGQKPRPPAPEPEPAPQPEPPPEPAPEPEPQPEPEREVIFEFSSQVTFELDSARLRPEAEVELNEAAALLKQHPEITRVEVAGHTCDLGTESYNQGLSERRAAAVREYLVDEGVEAGRLVTRGYGESRPKVPNSSEANRKQNRRTELVVLRRRDN